MILQVLGSESSGNCYLLRYETETLIIEAGIRPSEVKKVLNYDLSTVVGCIVSHEHMDHFKYIKDFAKMGITVWLSPDTIQNKSIDLHNARPYYVSNVNFITKSFSFIPFPVPHPVPNHGFLIHHPESGKILFVTDAAYIKNKFVKLSHLLIEANFEDSIMTNDRAVGKHMSIDTTINFLRANDLSCLRTVVLLHLSAGNSDAKLFYNLVAENVPKTTSIYIGDKGLSINLDKYPF